MKPFIDATDSMQEAAAVYRTKIDIAKHIFEQAELAYTEACNAAYSEYKSDVAGLPHAEHL